MEEGATAADIPPAEGGGLPLYHKEEWFGHPRGLSTLFFTEMWERFSYYGMRALLVLFMTAPLAGKNPGLGFGVEKSAAIYGLYTSMVYLLSLPGGWVADKIWGQRRAVFVGGCIIAAGHFSMAAPVIGLPDHVFFFLGLILIVIGTGLLKPNVSTIVGDLYPQPEGSETDERVEAAAEHWGARRDAGFSIFYMGINIGAVLGPTLCGWIGEDISFHWGFSLAGFGMVLGLIQYKIGDKYFGEAGLLKGDDTAEVLSKRSRNFYLTTAAVVAAIGIFAYLGISGLLPVTLVQVGTWLGYGILLVVLLFFAYLIFDPKWAAAFAGLWLVLVAVFNPAADADLAGRKATIGVLAIFIVMCVAYLIAKRDTIDIQHKRYMVIFWLFLLAAIFWSGFEQAGSSMNLFARDLTDRVLFGWEVPTTWLQNINPIFIVILAPVFGWLWTWLADRHKNPSIPMKFSLGLLGLAAGFFVLAWGAANATTTAKVGMSWLVVTYFLHTVGELCLSPVGLSSMTKLAPKDRVGQMMGIWFVAAALGNLFAGLVAGQLEDLAPSALFSSVAMFVAGAGIFALLLSPFAKKLTGGIE
ncbi:MAG: peptide MFS transporter [Thermoanaerobaculia bacterium]|nr:peptide MFS transporter [Thermoanaerobaculia bacterium]